MKQSLWFGFAIVAVSGLIACERREMGPSGERTTGQEQQPMGQAEQSGQEEEPMAGERQPVKGQEQGSASKVAQSLTRARCEAEQRCGKIGSGKNYSSMDACMKQVGSEWQEELNERECPNGIDSKELNECVEEIRGQDCGEAFGALERITACRSSDLCK